MSDRYADHDAAWHRDMETEAAAQEPREDVEAQRILLYEDEIDRLKARLEQTERALQTELRAVNTLRGVVEDAEARAEAAERVEESLKAMLAAATIKRDEYQARAEAAERALREIADMEPNAGSENQPVFIARAALASSEGEKKRVLINTRTGERREWEPGLVLQAEGPLEWELREE